VKKPSLFLGYAVGSGEPVEIPLGHMAVTGQTQAAGKTTTLESLAHRSGRSVIAFVTKRGEGSFGAAPGHSVHAAKPYFRERADWQFVEAVLEATMRERMKYERQWIMKVSRGAGTLRDVRTNTAKALENARGEFMKGTYEKLLAYLDIVVPQLSKIQWDTIVHLYDGLNVMDLSGMTSELQALVIASCLDFVMEFQRDVTVIVPEAWEFIPRGRKSPVTLSAESYVRKGAALGNFLWIDSQDLAGVHTPILKSTHVFLLGVQREINEIKRTIAHLHGPAKPKPDQIAQLGLGQFVACHGSTAVTTYVQTWWAQPAAAQEAARTGGRAGVHDSVLIDVPRRQEEDPMDAELKRQNDQLKIDNRELQRQVRELTARLDKIPITERRDWDAEPDAPSPPSSSGSLPVDWLQQVRTKLLADAQVLAAVARIRELRPEIVIDVTPTTISYDGGSPKGRLAKMIRDGIMNEPVKPGVLIAEYKRTGSEVHPSRLSEYLGEFVQNGWVIRLEGMYQKSPVCKVTTRELQAVV